jgi:hypothetical protein
VLSWSRRADDCSVMDKHGRSVAAYSEALGLWRGEPWAELAESPR